MTAYRENDPVSLGGAHVIQTKAMWRTTQDPDEFWGEDLLHLCLKDCPVCETPLWNHTLLKASRCAQSANPARGIRYATCRYCGKRIALHPNSTSDRGPEWDIWLRDEAGVALAPIQCQSNPGGHQPL